MSAGTLCARADVRLLVTGVATAACLLLSSADRCLARSLPSEDAARIRTVAIAPVVNPTHVRLSTGNVGGALALDLTLGVGAMVGELEVSRIISGKRRQLDRALAPAHLSFGDEIASAAADVLSQDGYEAVAESPSAPADATLSFEIQDIAYERRVWGAIGPRLIVQATLTDRSGKEVFSRLYWYDMHAVGIGKTVLTPEDKYGFDDEQSVLDHPDVAAAGLRAAIPMMMSDLAVALKKPSP